jgi:hypothetical protein
MSVFQSGREKIKAVAMNAYLFTAITTQSQLRQTTSVITRLYPFV